LGLGGHAEVYDAEMAALALGAAKAAEFVHDNPNISHIAFFTDNSSATKAIVDPKPQAAQFFAHKFHQAIRPILNSHVLLSISISWCPSHCDIPGNDRADHLAKEATALECQIPFPTTRTNALRRSKQSTLKIWQQEWKNTPKTGRYAISNRTAPSLQPTPHFREL
ncbi:hypothetical protein B0H34DRAFT_633411, partial [Crassisporium funariophilum]